ncbi:MAG TPA: hypothetical protein VIL97_08575 [Thermoanaerobaculia bacterium]
MKRLGLAVAIAFVTLNLLAVESKLRVTRSPNQKAMIDVRAENASLIALVKALELHLGVPVRLEMSGDLLVTFSATRISPWDALAAVARSSGLAIDDRKDHLAVRLASEPTVTMDVKDMEVREIFQIVKTQCGVRNLIVDPNVQGKGTFLFHGVPCSAAFKTILNSLGLEGEAEPNSVVLVDPRR